MYKLQLTRCKHFLSLIYHYCLWFKSLNSLESVYHDFYTFQQCRTTERFFGDQFVFIYHSEIAFQCTANENRCVPRQPTLTQHKVNSILLTSDHTLQAFFNSCAVLRAVEDKQKRSPVFVFFHASVKQRYTMNSCSTDAHGLWETCEAKPGAPWAGGPSDDVE